MPYESAPKVRIAPLLTTSTRPPLVPAPPPPADVPVHPPLPPLPALPPTLLAQMPLALSLCVVIVQLPLTLMLPPGPPFAPFSAPLNVLPPPPPPPSPP